MPVAIGPCPEFLEDPRRLAARRVGQPVTERLRPGGLLLGITGIPVGIILDPLQRPRLLRRRLTLDIGPRRHRKRDVNAGTMVAIQCPKPGRDRRTPVTALRAVARV